MFERRPPKHAEIGDIWIDVSVRESHSAQAEVSEHPVEEGAAIADHVRPTPRTIEIEGLVTNHPIEVPQSHAGGARASKAPRSIEVAMNPLPRIAPDTRQIEGEPSVGVVGFVPGVDQAVALLGALKLDVRTKQRFAMQQYTTDPTARTSYRIEALNFSEPFNRVEEVHAALLRIVDESQLVTVVTALITYKNVALTDLQVERSSEVGRNALKFTATGRVLRLVSTEVVALNLPKMSKSRGKQATTVVPGGLVPIPKPPENNDAFDWRGLFSPDPEDPSNQSGGQ